MENETQPSQEDKFGAHISNEENRKIKAQGVSSGSVWTGLGMFGMVGWSVAVPTLLGVALGLWLDRKFHQSISWTITFLMVGLAIGSLNAWYWIDREDKSMHQDKE
jgi:ATP synthase protein I